MIELAGDGHPSPAATPSDWGRHARAINLGAINAEAHRCLDSDLLRKEVIQPHLPVRLPCYDLAPVTDPTFGALLPCGLEQRLRVLPAPIA